MKITEKYVLNLILSIVLVFSLVGSSAAYFAKQNLLSADTFIEVSDENEIPQKVYDEINKYFTQSAAYSRIPADVYMSAITVEEVKSLIDVKVQSMFTYIYAVGQGEIDNLDFLDTAGSFDYEQQLEKNVTDFFDEFAKKNNVEVNDEYTAQLRKTIETANSEINNATDVYMLALIDQAGIIDKVRSIYNYIDPAMYICVGIAVLCVVLIIVCSRKRIGNIFYWISTSVMCMSALCLAPVLYLKVSGVTKKLIIENESVYTVYTELFSNILNTLLLGLTVIFAIGVVMLIVGLVISKFSKKEN